MILKNDNGELVRHHFLYVSKVTNHDTGFVKDCLINALQELNDTRISNCFFFVDKWEMSGNIFLDSTLKIVSKQCNDLSELSIKSYF